MFEQTLLPENVAADRKWTFAASMTLQMTALSILLLVPLIYTDRISFFAPDPPLPVVFRQVQPEPLVERSAAQPERAGPSILRVFRQPPRINPLIQDAALETAASAPVIPFEGPARSSAIGVPDGVAHAIAELRGARPPETVSVVKPAIATPVRVTSTLQEAKLIHRVVPEYPRLAVIARVSGTVKLTGIIAKDGTIRHLQVLSGPPLLIHAALDAVRQWVYKPTILTGEPVEVIAPIDVIFRLDSAR